MQNKFTHINDLNLQRCFVVKEVVRQDLIDKGIVPSSVMVLVENEDETREIIFPWEITHITPIGEAEDQVADNYLKQLDVTPNEEVRTDFVMHVFKSPSKVERSVLSKLVGKVTNGYVIKGIETFAHGRSYISPGEGVGFLIRKVK